MLASEAVHAVPLGLVGEHGGGEGDVPLQHAGEALLLVLAGGAVVHRPRHVRRAVPGNISRIELSTGLRKNSASRNLLLGHSPAYLLVSTFTINNLL